MRLINGEPVHFDPGVVMGPEFLEHGPTEYERFLYNKAQGVGIELKPSYFVQAQRNIAEVSKTGWNEATNQEELFIEDDEMEDVTA